MTKGLKHGRRDLPKEVGQACQKLKWQLRTPYLYLKQRVLLSSGSWLRNGTIVSFSYSTDRYTFPSAEWPMLTGNFKPLFYLILWANFTSCENHRMTCCENRTATKEMRAGYFGDVKLKWWKSLGHKYTLWTITLIYFAQMYRNIWLVKM